VALLSQGRTAAAQCGLFTYKSVPVIFEPPCTLLDSKKTKPHPLPSGPFLSQMSLVHTATTYVFKIQHTFTAPSLLRLILRNFFLSSGFLNKVQGSQEFKSCHTQNY